MCQFKAKCEVIDLTLSDRDSDGDFIQAKNAKVKPKSLSVRFRYAYLTGLVHVRSDNCSHAKLGRLIVHTRSCLTAAAS